MKKHLIQLGTLCMTLTLALASTAWAQNEDDFVLVEGGTFTMGHEEPHQIKYMIQHEVTLTESFYMCIHEVTNKEYEEVMKKNPSKFKGDNRPVDQISWYDAIEYCVQRSLNEGLTPCYKGSRKNGYTCDFNANGYRLPTEAEWEYAARGGKKDALDTDYSGSDDIDRVAWYEDNSGDKTHNVMTKAPNELGIYDMCGNVKEWCWDAWERLDDPSSVTNPTGRSKIDKDTFFILRGGEYDDEPEYCTVFDRSDDAPNRDVIGYGLRVVRTASKADLETAQEAEKPSEAKKARPALKNKRAQGRAKRK
ncbi:MAG: formylglycine-generating enzyme family protein [Treponema sp.]|nr:formylglycine-generating enzyme family protein [Treponema sp.]